MTDVGHGMIYFRTCSIILGALMVAGGLAVSFWSLQVKRWIEKIYPETRPRWILGASVAALLLTIWTWYQYLTGATMYSFVVTLVVSLTMAKMALATLFYKKFREIAMTLMGEPLALRVVMMSSAAVGAAILALGLFF